MVHAKPGARYRSVVCSTEVAIVKGPGGELDLRCGGEPLAALDAATTATDTGGAPAPGLDGGTAVGKRYVDADETVEVLCTKAGAGTLALGDEPLAVKGAKPLPASD